MTGIDPHTGALTMPDGIVSRDTTKASVLASPMFREGHYTNERAGWYMAFLERQRMDGLLFDVGLMFHGEHLHKVTLTHSDPGYEPWSRESEETRRQRHDEWLLATLGSTRRDWPWGKLYSENDEKTGGSSILLVYRDKQTCELTTPP